MTNVNANAKTQAPKAGNKGYFNTVMYARAYINSVRTVEVKKGNSYVVCSASIIDLDKEGKKIYTPIELNLSGENLNTLFNEFESQWPTRDDKSRWIADIAVGSISAKTYHSKKYSCNKAQLKGRLINVASLNIEGKTVFGEQKEFKKPSVLANAYLNEIDLEDNQVIASMMDGKVSEPIYTRVSLKYSEKPQVFDNLNEQGLLPRGYEYREENAKIYTIIKIEDLEPILYEHGGEEKAALIGTLNKVCYLKANDTVMFKKKTNTEKFVEGFKEGFTNPKTTAIAV